MKCRGVRQGKGGVHVKKESCTVSHHIRKKKGGKFSSNVGLARGRGSKKNTVSGKAPAGRSLSGKLFA